MIHITFIRGFSEPYETSYYEQLTKNERLREKIFHLEDERDIAVEEAARWKGLLKTKLINERLDNRESIICTISRLQYLLDELENIK